MIIALEEEPIPTDANRATLVKRGDWPAADSALEVVHRAGGGR